MLSLNVPWASVMVPLLVFLILTDAPGTGSLVLLSIILPVSTLVCAHALVLNNSSSQHNNIAIRLSQNKLANCGKKRVPCVKAVRQPVTPGFFVNTPGGRCLIII
jgi:hypothetical protein